MNIFYLFFISSFLCSLSKAAASGSVLFMDGSDHRYIRRPSDVAQPQSMLLPEVGAAVSVLLGFPPSTSLSATGSLKLNEVLASNPFERPRAVFMLEVTGNDDPLVEHDNALFSHSFKSGVEYTNDAAIELPDADEVLVVSLDEQSEDYNVKDILNFALLFGGSFLTEGNELLNGVLTVPLQNGQKLELHMSKKADRKFVLGLLTLYSNIRRSIVMHGDFSLNMRRPAELLMGRLDGFKELDGGVSKGRIEFLLSMISKLFDSLQSAHKGQIVGVILFNGASPESKTSLNLKFAPQLPLRWLAEEKTSSDPTVLVKEIILVRKTLAWITGIVLLIATLLGVYFLVNMPLTRDTLLYSNVKFD